MITPNYTQRLKLFQKNMIEAGIDGALISKKENINYLTGYPSLHPTEREAYVIISPKHAILYHSPFISPSSHTPSILTIIAMSARHNLSQVLTQYLNQVTQLGIEKLDLTVAESERCLSELQHPPTVSIDSLLKRLRQIKDAGEINRLKAARRISLDTLNWIDRFIHSPVAIGISEINLAHRIEAKIIELGADRLSFPSIVAFDQHSASPHHIPTSKKLTPKSVVLTDIGAQTHGYNGDATRTWCLAPSPPPLFSKIETLVLKAYKNAFKLAVSGAVAAHIDSAARGVIDQAGFKDNFTHTTGHGLGLEAHEAPSLSFSNQEVIQPGMVITIEPGIYLPGQFGYRHENTLIIS